MASDRGLTGVGTDRRSRVLATTRGILGASHPGPTLTVTMLATLLATASGLSARRTAQVTAAVLAGQLSIGWGNDLLDAERDRATGRPDKPVASGVVDPRLVGGLTASALVGCTILSATLGRRSALAHLGLVAIPAHAYNLGLKGTSASWVPYAVAFGALPSMVSFAGPHAAPAPARVTASAAALGVGAHLLNTIRDLEDDRRTGVQGLPHRLGERRSRLLATGLLGSASMIVTAGGRALPVRGRPVVLALDAALGWVAVTGRDRAPFRAAMGVALLDAAVLLAESRAQARD